MRPGPALPALRWCLANLPPAGAEPHSGPAGAPLPRLPARRPPRLPRSIGVSEALKRSLLAQGVTAPNTIVNAVHAALSPLFNWLLIVHLGLGLDGAAREWGEGGRCGRVWPRRRLL